ncbi:Putative Ig domain protein [Maioricimonas rarisocia]|uniref:Ig domain protein n=1 Tax=Maioricimonas rarisocia TaxID=2528026 RepID=A0A517Z5G5_9PLAN|nr:cadherin repeat domain-containing protein [Maioricimonas rarisocia]QDU37740.1 Putative Ig domain protein [Maioricimonas rarisocia]
MQPREKVLAILLAVVVAGVVLVPAFERTFLDPLTELNGELKTVQMAVSARELDELKLMRATANLKDWRERSLPPDPLNAQRVYQEWLTDLALVANWNNVEVKLGRRSTRGATYAAVPVTIEARATLENVATFLRLFEATNLLHRISRLDLDRSVDPAGIQLAVTLTAEGLSLPDATQRTRLLPATYTAKLVDPEADSVTVVSGAGFPEEAPFRARIGSEIVDVTAVDGNSWKIQRGIAGTATGTHTENAEIELLPLVEEHKARASVAERLAASSSPFVKPRPPIEYKPHFASTTPPAAVRGEDYTFELKVEDWDPTFGNPELELGPDTPEGMRFDEETGTIRWSPSEELEPGPYPVSVIARSGVNNAPVIEATLDLTLRLPNNSPQLPEIGTIVAYTGRDLVVPIEASDPDLPNDKLQYALTGEVPDGVSIDSSSGELRWSIPLEAEPGERQVTVKVTDSGMPPAEDSQAVTLDVRDDAALYTYLVGCLVQEQTAQALLYDRSSNSNLLLTDGDFFEAADLQLFVLSIAVDHVTVSDGAEVYRLNIGRNFREMQLLPPEKPAGETATSEVSVSDPPESAADAQESAASEAEPAPDASGDSDANN